MKRKTKDIKYYEWYLSNGKCLHGKEVYDYLFPRYMEARRFCLSIQAQLNSFRPNGNLVNDYLELIELISSIECQIDVFEDMNR